VLVGDFIPPVLSTIHHVPDWADERGIVIAAISVVVLLPLSFFRDLNALRFTSLLGAVRSATSCDVIMLL
jgi:amino acid permease